jgi:hypothetical protein
MILQEQSHERYEHRKNANYDPGDLGAIETIVVIFIVWC